MTLKGYKEQGGRIWVESAGEGEGSAFVFALPAAGAGTGTPPGARPQARFPPILMVHDLVVSLTEGRARAVEVEGAADGSRILAVGSATAEAYEKRVEAVGQQNLATIEVTKAVAGAGLKITPEIVVSGADGGGGNLFAAFVVQLLANSRGALPGEGVTEARSAPMEAP